MEELDVVVVGAGAAGLAAGLTLARALRSVLIFDGGATRNARAAHSHGILGLDGASPADLAGRSRSEVERFGGVIRTDTVIDAASARTGGYVLRTAAGARVACRQVLIAGGVRDEVPPVPGVLELWGDRVVICPYCDGWEARNSSIGILGTGLKSITQAHLLRQWSNRVALFSNDVVYPSVDDLARLSARGITVVEGTVTSLTRSEDGVDLIIGESRHPCDIVFTAPRALPDNRVLAALGAKLIPSAAGLFPAIDGRGATSVAGVWAAGNAVNPSLKYSTALGNGMDTATHINEALVEADIIHTMSQQFSHWSDPH
jgi:thioredoxin reductase